MAAATETFEMKPAKRERVPLLVGIVGPSGSGKTWSALRLARGIQRVAGGSIAVIDTEARRALHYAESFEFLHIDFKAPFGSLRYLAAIRHCVEHGANTVVIDSASLEHEGEGGMLDAHEQELQRMAGNDYGKREAMKMLAWSRPKAARRKFLTGITQLNANLIFCFRAKSISKPVKVNGKTEVIPQGFTPISGDELIYEMTTNILLLPKSDGVPCWKSDNPGERMAMKLPGQFRDLFKQPAQLSEDIGQRLAEWAAGAVATSAPTRPAATASEPTGPADALADRYAAVKNRGGFQDLEGERAKLWPTIKPAEQKRVKEARDAAIVRLDQADGIPAEGAPAQ